MAVDIRGGWRGSDWCWEGALLGVIVWECFDKSPYLLELHCTIHPEIKESHLDNQQSGWFLYSSFYARTNRSSIAPHIESDADCFHQHPKQN